MSVGKSFAPLIIASESEVDHSQRQLRMKENPEKWIYVTISFERVFKLTAIHRIARKQIKYHRKWQADILNLNWLQR